MRDTVLIKNLIKELNQPERTETPILLIYKLSLLDDSFNLVSNTLNWYQIIHFPLIEKNETADFKNLHAKSSLKFSIVKL